MKTKEEIKEQMRVTKEYLDGLLPAAHPDDVEYLQEAKRLLIELENDIEEEWPLGDTEKATDMGVWVMREMQGGPFGELPEMMMMLAQDMGGGD